MEAVLRTLSESTRVGKSAIGTSFWGSRFEKVPTGRAVPSLMKFEDSEAILRCGFLDEATPIALNLTEWARMRSVLLQRVLLAEEGGRRIDPEDLLRVRPSFGYLPPELFSSPNVAGLKALYDSSIAGQAMARLRLRGGTEGEVDWGVVRNGDILPDAAYWTAVAKANVYARFIGDLLVRGENTRISLIAPPVPSLHEEWSGSADTQFETNAAASALIKPVGSTPAIRPLYSFSLHPSALGEPAILQRALDRLRLALAGSEYGFVGVYLSFTDAGAIATDGAPAVQTALDLSSKVTGIAAQSGRFTIVGDVGPVGPVFLDEGVAFTTYGMGMTMRRTYPMMRAPQTQTRAAERRFRESKYGKVLGGPWDYVLLRYRDVRNRGWKLGEVNGKFTNEVPPSLRGGPPESYRREFSKPYNTAVQEVLNDLREREIVVNQNARPGRAILARSGDPMISAWGAQS